MLAGSVLQFLGKQRTPVDSKSRTWGCGTRNTCQYFDAGTAGLVAGSMSMAAGEYVSVHSQADTELADLEREKSELSLDFAYELEELADIYVGRGLDKTFAKEVAKQLMSRDALGAHARDELGVTDALTARPVQAALASAASFGVGAGVPLLVSGLSSQRLLIPLVGVTSLARLAVLGTVAAQVGRASLTKGAVRVMFWESWLWQ